MPLQLDKWFARQSSSFKGLAVILMIGLVAWLDFITGYELSFSIFYLFPVVLAGWYVGKKFACLVSVISAVNWLVLDYGSGRVYSNIFIPFWDAFVRLVFFLVVMMLVTRLKSLLAYQEVLAELDGLTGLYNARAFREKCAALFPLAVRNKHAATLAYIDLDDFKGINDSLGHSTGDQVLQAVADTLRQRLRSSDLCARLGGDEFSVLLPETDEAGAKAFFTELHASLCQMAERHQWPIGFSIGVAVFPRPDNNFDQAVRQADQLMYAVKHAGKNNVRFQVFDSR